MQNYNFCVKSPKVVGPQKSEGPGLATMAIVINAMKMLGEI